METRATTVAAGGDELIKVQTKIRRSIRRLVKREAADLDLDQQDVLNARLADHYRRFPAPWRPADGGAR
jgi:hypothetical protein